MIDRIAISTRARTELFDITRKIEELIKKSKVRSGVCHIFVPHTTAGLTINENADPNVKDDILNGLERAVPFDSYYAHSEGNAAAHIKSTLAGTDKVVLIENGAMKLGTWQGIFFCEFDGPRQRNIFVHIQAEQDKY